jgi:hypothetical protein
MVRISDLIRGNTPIQTTKKEIPEQGMKYNLRYLFHSIPENQAPEDTSDTREMEEPFPESPASSETEPASFEAVTSYRPEELYQEAQNYLMEARDKLRAGEPVNLAPSLNIIEAIIEDASLVEGLYALTAEGGHDDDLDIASPVNSMIYSFKVGKRMGYSAFKLTEVCMAALHHDIGMFLIDDAISGKEGRLTDEEFTELKKHTAYGRDIMKAVDETFPSVSRAIYEHHERENGQGYPLGLKGDDICEYAKIIAICDSYEAMTHNRPYRKAGAQHKSVLEIAEAKDELFSPHIIKIFLDEITMYPVGSYVRLNNKAVGIVVETNPTNPLKPVINLVMDGHGKRVLQDKRINLADNNILNIQDSVLKAEIFP